VIQEAQDQLGLQVRPELQAQQELREVLDRSVILVQQVQLEVQV
jgi:hypothetical protein